jgi:hypothetical protein
MFCLDFTGRGIPWHPTGGAELTSVTCTGPISKSRLHDPVEGDKVDVVIW